MHRLKRAQRVFAPSATKSKSYPLKTPQNRADEFYGYEVLCTRLAGGRFHPEFTPDNSKPAPNRLKTVNGDAIYCVAVKRCRRSRKTGFQHVQESGSSTAGNHVMASRRTTHHTIHRRLFTRVVPRVAASKKQPNGESCLESGRY